MQPSFFQALSISHPGKKPHLQHPTPLPNKPLQHKQQHNWNCQQYDHQCIFSKYRRCFDNRNQITANRTTEMCGMANIVVLGFHSIYRIEQITNPKKIRKAIFFITILTFVFLLCSFGHAGCAACCVITSRKSSANFSV